MKNPIPTPMGMTATGNAGQTLGKPDVSADRMRAQGKVLAGGDRTHPAELAQERTQWKPILNGLFRSMRRK
jgi:hypothetical protein